MKTKAVSGIMLTLLLTSIAMVSVPVQASPSPVTFYVNMPHEGYISGKSVGTIFAVDIYVNASELIPNTPEGMVGWGIDVKVNPAVLEPMGVDGAKPGYFLYDFFFKGVPRPITPPMLMVGSINKTTGYIDEVSEQIMSTPSGGAGGTGKLVTLWFESKSETAYSPIDISIYQYDPGQGEDVWQAVYMDATPTWHDAEVMDGHYNQPPSPQDALEDLIQTVESWDLNTGIETSLTSILRGAYRSLDKENPKASIRQLTAFMNEAEALRDNKLNNEQADYLISEAQRIIDLIEG